MLRYISTKFSYACFPVSLNLPIYSLIYYIIQELLKAFLLNLSSESAQVRRTAATCIVSICRNCRKPKAFIMETLNTLVGENYNAYTVISLVIFSCNFVIFNSLSLQIL